MPKNVSLLVGGMGVGMSILTRLVEKARQKGLSDEDIHRLATPDGEPILDRFIAIMCEARTPKPEMNVHVIDLDANPFVPDGWEIEEHIKGGKFEWDPARVALYLSESQQNGKIIQGSQLREELKGKPVFNANLLDYLLAHPELIPEEWKDKYVFFWGTIYRDRGGDLRVRCLYWHDGRWHWDFYWLEGGFRGYDPAAVPASSSQ